MVRKRGLEPLWVTPPDPKSGASANFATSALLSLDCTVIRDIADSPNIAARPSPAPAKQHHSTHSIPIAPGYARQAIDQRGEPRSLIAMEKYVEDFPEDYLIRKMLAIAKSN